MIKIKKYREKLDLTQKEVAEILGLSQAQYNKHKNGKSELTVRQLLLLCDLFKVTPNDLLEFKKGEC